MSRLASSLARPRAFAFTSGVAAWLILGVGVILRLVEYASNRPLYLDEELLRANLVGRPVFDLSGPLLHDQLAPPGFLVAERLAAWSLGGSAYALRLFPLICGVTALFLVRRVALSVLDPWLVPVALALFAVSDDLIYYATEIKQYSTDMAVALACLAMGLDLSRFVSQAPGATGGLPASVPALSEHWRASRQWHPEDEHPGSRLTARRIVVGTLVGIAATWFSHPAAFVLAGVGACLIARAAAGRRWAAAWALAAMAAAWAASFAACYAASLRLLAPGPFMWTWWGFAFLPIPPASMAQAEQLFWSLANVFTDPVGLTTPFGMLPTALLGLGLFALGALAMARRRADALGMLVAPLLIAVLASGLHKYPFHGRLLYFLVPGLIVVIAEGLGAIGRRVGRWATYALLGLLLLCPGADALDHWVHARTRPFDTHGDLRNDLLDELEARGVWPRGR